MPKKFNYQKSIKELTEDMISCSEEDLNCEQYENDILDWISRLMEIRDKIETV